MQNTANGIALKTKDDMLRLDAMVMTVQLGIRKLLVSLQAYHFLLIAASYDLPRIFGHLTLAHISSVMSEELSNVTSSGSCQQSRLASCVRYRAY